ncbi:hypothetical protein [Caldimonas sp. KR1-144]|uniref:hypothetical protein n=1 Tax=Caldimonas sp. KR1-144 TaxID=3400911 RepID=UPI003C02BB5E
MTTPDGQQLDLRFDHSTFGEDDGAKREDHDRLSADVVVLSTFRHAPRIAQQREDEDERTIVQRALASVRLFS